uniref:Uncharacterized protein n=1 Tax=uncultured marine group II/III euryarchaeote KM3_157_B03 TaxID=1457902 RepID=A0A075GEK3_9EURY|nr:hypothetical protein [uncultured marine group II/III euryarchaeote KM3_157_B03]
MALGTGIRLNGALSILLVMLLVLGGMASMSSLEMNDAAAAGDSGDDAANSDEKKDASTLEKSESAWLERCKQMKSNMPDRSDWDKDDEKPLRDRDAAGRQADTNGNNDSTDNNSDNTDADVDWHLPDNIVVSRTTSGEYVIRIVDADGTVTEEVVTEEGFALFLRNHGWTTTDEVQENQTDRVEHDWVQEEMSGLDLEILDDGTIIITRTRGEWVEYEIIRTSEDGSTTVIRVNPRGTEVVHPQPPREHHQRENMGDRDRGERGFAPLFSFAGEMDEGIMDRCKELMQNDKPTIDVDVLRLDRPVAERDERRK